MGGVCYDVSDIDARSACQRYKGGSASLFHSDSCSPSELLAVVGAGSDCRALGSQISSNVWGVLIDGECRDISDTDFATACERFGHSPTGGGSTKLYHSDRCEGEVLAAIGPAADCRRIGEQVSSRVWGVKLGGHCYDVSDTDARTACERYKGETKLFHSDRCDASELLASIGSRSDCAALGAQISSRVWAIEIDGQCHDISDVDMRTACERFGGGVALYHSDRCEPSELLSLVGSETDCAALGAQISSRVWGVKIDGECIDISDTDVRDACQRYGAGL